MRIVSLPRRGGKTMTALRWLQDAPEGEHRVMLCFSAHESMRLLRLSRDLGMGLESWQFVSAEEARQPWALSGALLRGGHLAFGFDNLDLWLSSHFGRQIIFGTVTEDEP